MLILHIDVSLHSFLLSLVTDLFVVSDHLHKGVVVAGVEKAGGQGSVFGGF